MLKTIVHTKADYALTISPFVLGILFFVHGSQLMTGWFGGYEYHLLAIALGLVVVLRGSGALSLDRLLLLRRESVPVEVDGLRRIPAPAVTPRSYRTNNTRGNR